MPQSKELSGKVTIKMTGSITISNAAYGYHNQKYCQGVPQSKDKSGSSAIKMTARECHTQTDCKGVS